MTSMGIDSTELLDEALKHGFVLERQTNHRIIKRGAMTFTLPTTGTASPWLVNTLRKVFEQIDAKTPRKMSAPPIVVEWQGKPWAVNRENYASYFLQSLDSGKTQWVAKTSVTIPDYEEHIASVTSNNNGHSSIVSIRQVAEETQQVFGEEITGQIEQSVRVNIPADHQSPMAQWIIQTNRTIDRLAVEAEQHRLAIADIESQMDTLVRARAIITGHDSNDAIKSDARTTRKRVSEETVEEIRKLLADTDMPVKDIALKYGVSDSFVYYIKNGKR